MLSYLFCFVFGRFVLLALPRPRQEATRVLRENLPE